MDLRLKEKVALVTGAGSQVDFGKETALQIFHVSGGSVMQPGYTNNYV